MEHLKDHQQLYKSPRGRTPPWKDVYRKKCFERLRARRANLIEKFRFSGTAGIVEPNNGTAHNSPIKVVSDIMEIEWASIKQNRGFPSLKSNNLESSSVEEWDEELMRETFQEIQAELIGEEEYLLNEILQFDNAAMESQVAMLQNEEVICPVCKTRRLEEELRGSYFYPTINSFQTPPKIQNLNGTSFRTLKCGCGLILSRADLSLNMVRSALLDTISLHERSCSHPLDFSVTSDNTGTNVLITCSSCDWMSFLL